MVDPSQRLDVRLAGHCRPGRILSQQDGKQLLGLFQSARGSFHGLNIHTGFLKFVNRKSLSNCGSIGPFLSLLVPSWCQNIMNHHDPGSH